MYNFCTQGAHFVELCCQRKIPIVFLQNIVKEAPSSDSEQMAVTIKDQAKMMHAVACSEVQSVFYLEEICSTWITKITLFTGDTEDRIE